MDTLHILPSIRISHSNPFLFLFLINKRTEEKEKKNKNKNKIKFSLIVFFLLIIDLMQMTTVQQDEYSDHFYSSSSDSFKESEARATPLSAVADAFEDLSRSLLAAAGSREDFRLVTFCKACALVSVLFSTLGLAFKFAEMEYVSKVNDLLEASKTFDTLSNILDYDMENDSVKKPGSHSRNLRRVRLGLDLIKALFEQFLSSSDCTLKDAASTAYAQVCAPYHTWAIRKAVGAGMYALPTREQLLVRLNEDDQSVEKEMRRYMVACSPIIEYIDNLYLVRNISLDW